MNGKKLHFVGAGGIGMSGLAQFCQACGYTVSGSDRGAAQPENQRIFRSLTAQKISIYPQDGSYIEHGKPDALIYSSAIESDNPDFNAAIDLPRLHRSEALALALQSCGVTPSIAVSGSCGKTSVTSYIAEALVNLGENPGALNGGLIKAFHDDRYAGNFRPGKKYFVFEADESDKSLLNYAADYALVLNIGTDHYEKEELARVFAEFVRHARQGAVLFAPVYEAVKAALPPELPIRVFHAGDITDYRVENGEAQAEFFGSYRILLPQPGFHTALNLLAAGVVLEMLGFEWPQIAAALSNLHGVWRRFDLAGSAQNGARIFDDYAHNPEKVCCVIAAAQELTGPNGRVFAVFQPHGYGPLGFMRDELYSQLVGTLRGQDAFFLLEPYYAGGTSSFRPTSLEVSADWQSRGGLRNLRHAPSRDAVRDALQETHLRSEDIVLILGARDNSLSDWAGELANSL